MSNTNQAIIRHSYLATVTFTGTPGEATRKALMDAGFIFDGRSKQWYRKQEEASVKTEEEVAPILTA
jgi:hypothetical protein